MIAVNIQPQVCHYIYPDRSAPSNISGYLGCKQDLEARIQPCSLECVQWQQWIFLLHQRQILGQLKSNCPWGVWWAVEFHPPNNSMADHASWILPVSDHIIYFHDHLIDVNTFPLFSTHLTCAHMLHFWVDAGVSFLSFFKNIHILDGWLQQQCSDVSSWVCQRLWCTKGALAIECWTYSQLVSPGLDPKKKKMEGFENSLQNGHRTLY